MGKMKIKEALAGVLPNKADKVRYLRSQVVRADALRSLIMNKNWSEMLRILDKYRNEAVQELGTKGIEHRDWLRINHRMELLADINNEIQMTLQQGEEANRVLSKMKE